MKAGIQSLREKVHHQRRSLASPELRVWNGLITDRVLGLALYRRADSIALYSPVENEVDTEKIRDNALLGGKRVFYPKLGKEEFPCFVRIDLPEDMGPGRYGISEPMGDERMTSQIGEGVVIFVPGLAFDLQGNRLGRGGGWYDRALRLLGAKAIRIALAYEFQIVDELSLEDWDEKVDQIVTEQRVIQCDDCVSLIRKL